MPQDPGPSVAALRFISEQFVWIVLAMVGGIVRYLDAYLRGGQPPKLGLMLGHAIVSGFSGYMVALVVLKYSTDWALVAAGVGGYMGTQALDWAFSVMRARFGPPPGPPGP